jgi:hypothetical protein
MARRLALLALFLVAPALALGCKSKSGDKCNAGQTACADKSTGLFCVDGKYTTMSCNGPLGCAKNGADVECDNSLAAENDGCNQPGDVSCASDHKAALECKNNKFAVGETCKGAGGCVIKGDKITCDNDISDVGDPCHFIGDYACTSDKAMVLRCDDNKMTALNSCRGPKSCRVIELPEEKKVEFACDDSVAQENDPCDTNGEEACSMDKKALFSCKSNKFVNTKACSGPAGCTYDEKSDKFACDTGGAVASATAGKTAGATATAPAAGAKGGKKGK